MLPGFYEHTRAREWLRILIKVWCTAVSTVLGLKSYLLGSDLPEDEGDQVNEDGVRIPGRGGADEGPNPGMRVHHAFAQRDVPLGFQPYARPGFFAVRLMGLLVCIGITLIIVSFVNLTIPVALGRKALQLIGRATDNGRAGGAAYFKEIAWGIAPTLAEAVGPINENAPEEKSFYDLIADCLWKFFNINLEKPHELYTAVVGAGTCWELARMSASAINLFPQGWRVIGQKIRSMFAKTANHAKAAFVFVLLFGLAPLLFGLLLELVMVVPMRVSINQTPVLFLMQDWTLGVLYMKITCAMLMMGPDTKLKLAIERAYQDGVRNINLSFIIKELAIPVIMTFGLMLAVPYVVAYSLAPLVVENAQTLRYIHRRVYPATFVIIVLSVLQDFVVKR